MHEIPKTKSLISNFLKNKKSLKKQKKSEMGTYAWVCAKNLRPKHTFLSILRPSEDPTLPFINCRYQLYPYLCQLAGMMDLEWFLAYLFCKMKGMFKRVYYTCQFFITVLTLLKYNIFILYWVQWEGCNKRYHFCP